MLLLCLLYQLTARLLFIYLFVFLSCYSDRSVLRQLYLFRINAITIMVKVINNNRKAVEELVVSKNEEIESDNPDSDSDE